MAAIDINHVSVSARDLQESLSFYEDLFGAERIATPRFAIPVLWTRLGTMQLHLFQAADARAPRAQHFAITVNLEDFEAIFVKAQEAGALDATAFGHYLYELPGGEGQMYLRDPGGNLVEVNCAAVAAAGSTVRMAVKKLAEEREQGEEGLKARLFLTVLPRAST